MSLGAAGVFQLSTVNSSWYNSTGSRSMLVASILVGTDNVSQSKRKDAE